MSNRIHVALISKVFTGPTAEQDLKQTLLQARDLGAEWALLPELPLNEWSPAERTPQEADAEPIGGSRTQIQREAAAQAGVGLIGGILSKDDQGLRRNTALVISPSGDLLGTFSKIHLPDEPGFWECDHYVPGTTLSPIFNAGNFGFGVQICSDINRIQGSQILAHHGALAVMNPRATEAATYERWRHSFFATALTCCCYVLSANRPAPEQGVLLGGASICVSPLGDVLVEDTDEILVAELDRAVVEEAKTRYPGYLPVYAEMYAQGWREQPEIIP